jgi:hypothetical protein
VSSAVSCRERSDRLAEDVGLHTRSQLEAAIGRYKQVIGDGLRCRKDERRVTEVAVRVLNHMLELGRPISVRIA